ncbi:MAG: translation initiation factor IF-2 [Bacteroidales bacterium]
MAEEIKKIRLSKAAKEFNIGVQTAIDFLVKKGHVASGEITPNTPLNPAEYEILAREFQAEKSVKETASKINLELHQKKASLSIEETIKVDAPEEEEELFRIKSMNISNEPSESVSTTAKNKATTRKASQGKKSTVSHNKEKETSDQVELFKESEPEVEEKEKEVEAPVKVEEAKEVEVSAKVEEAKEVEAPVKVEEVKEIETLAKVENEKSESVHPIEDEKPLVEDIPNPIQAKNIEEVIPSKEEAQSKEHVSELSIQEEVVRVEPKVKECITPIEQSPEIEKPAKVEAEEEKLENIATENNVKSEEIEVENGPRIVGKIDLSSINSRTRPDKKPQSKDGKKATHTKEKPKSEGGQSTKKPNAYKEDPNKKEETYKHKEASTTHKAKDTNGAKGVKPLTETPNLTPLANTPLVVAPVAEEDNFLKTEYTKLEGPKIVGAKIDLSQFDKKSKPVASSKEDLSQNKKKRKRIKDDKPVGAVSSVVTINRPDQKGNANNSAGGNSWNKKDKNKRGGNHKIAPVPVDAQEIEKQIKETLARLSPLGKSKTSKHRREKRANVNSSMHEEQERMMQEQKILKVTEFVTVNELATMMNIPVTKIIATCMSLGLFVSINQRLTADPISLVAEEYGFDVEFVDAEVMDNIEEEEEVMGELVSRTPIVTVMGHVDHGKTSVLDYIRKTNVIAGEAGGITQHIGAYEVRLENGKKITFLDTPGHEAFTAMRARGAKVTDIAIIVIAADDRIMPQTIEAINHAQAAGVPLVFAINKIDKPGADPQKIKQALAEMNLLVEEWGGKYQSQDISAKQGLNMEQLLEKVLLEAEMLELKATPDRRAKGTVIESSLDKGRGYVAKILIQDGSVKIGDHILAGVTYGTVKAMYNERNQVVQTAGPSTPVLMLGLNGAPQAGDIFNVVANAKDAKDAATRRHQLQREQGLRAQKHITLDEIGRRIAIGDFKELNIIVKGDVDGSIEALSDSLLKLSTPEVQVNVIHKSVGQITESDVLLASASNAVIIGFQVRPSQSARKLAEAEQIDIRLYSIIYDAINEIKDAIEGMLSPEIQEKIVCNLEIREVFKIGKLGSIAGSFVLDGKINRQTKVRIIRDGIVVHTGKLGSLRRFKDDVKEAVAGQDCGLNIENFNDVKVGDIIEGYEQTEVKRSL